MQFKYVNFKPPYKYPSQLGAILKREYPGLVEDKDENDVCTGTPRPALEWDDYFLSRPNELGVTSGDRVLSEFWRLFEVAEEDKEEADRVLENYLKKRVKDMMYQARVDAVKEFYRQHRGQKLDDTLARPIELEYGQYIKGKLKWCNDEVWPELCRLWCSLDFLKKRKRGQLCRLSSEDTAQNHGGSRPFTETQQVLEFTFGPEKATPLNTYAVMKSGIKCVDSNGICGEIRSRKAQKRMDDYNAGVRRPRVACPEQEDEDQEGMEEEEHDQQQEHDGMEGEHEHQHQQEQNLNEQVLYDVSEDSRTHGRFAIAHGAVRAADVKAAANGRCGQLSSSMSKQSMARQMAQLRRENARLQQENLRLSASQAIGTGSSHAASESAINGVDGGHNNEDQELSNHAAMWQCCSLAKIVWCWKYFAFAARLV
ncbi:unnamed protein product [Urochloa humidicola]